MHRCGQDLDCVDVQDGANGNSSAGQYTEHGLTGVMIDLPTFTCSISAGSVLANNIVYLQRPAGDRELRGGDSKYHSSEGGHQFSQGSPSKRESDISRPVQARNKPISKNRINMQHPASHLSICTGILALD